MAARQVSLGSRRLAPQKAIVSPNFRSKTVLGGDPWDYVKMWLRRKRKEEALFYWDQAQHFHLATLQLPNTSAPLTAYYCFLNATKALLTVRGQRFVEHHGVAGESTSRRAALSNEAVRFRDKGVLATICTYLGEPTTATTYSLKDILYNLVYIHRAYKLTFSSQPELFTPIANLQFVKKPGSPEAWFCAEIRDTRYATQHTVNKLPADYEKDAAPEHEKYNRFVIRRRSRFDWRRGSSNAGPNLKRLTTYHQAVRRSVHYINGPSTLWYLKRRSDQKGMIARGSLTLAYAAMHRLSELARYEPTRLASHLSAQHNWLLSEFISLAPGQFIDEISAEITGQDFMAPGLRGASPR